MQEALSGVKASRARLMNEAESRRKETTPSTFTTKKVKTWPDEVVASNLEAESSSPLKVDYGLAARTALQNVKQDLATKEVEQWVRSELESTDLRESVNVLGKRTKVEDKEEPRKQGLKLNVISGKTFGMTKEGTKIMSIISVAGHQVVKNLSEPSEITLVHLDIYADYLKEKDPKLDSRAVRALLTTGGPRLMKVDGHYIDVHGPYPILMNVDGINIYTKAHITAANDQIGRIYIGQEELKVRRIGHNAMLEQDAVHIGCEANLAAHVLDVQGRQLSVKGLLDTGAVVSVMPVKTWTDMGFERSDLIPTNIRLAAANQGAIYVTGLSGCSNFPERPTEAELAANKPVLPEIEHLKGKITDKELDSLRAVLNRSADVFSKHKADIGCCNFVEHEIEIEEGSVPHREGARRMTPNKSEACRKEIEMLMEYDMIEPSKSPWACGVVMAKKKGGQLRFCCDFRYLNAVTIKDAYPIPRIDESLSKLGDAKFFTTLDLGSAFWQVPLRKLDREKTGFACEMGLFQWKRMPFGLCNATATFQRLMAQALTSVTKKYGNLIMCYVDDVVIATPTLEDHIERLEEVFSCMKQAGLKCKPSKCEILRDSIKYLGRLVDKHGVRPDPEAVEAVLTWKAPKTDTQLMSFLGFAEFIKGYADKIYPMQRLMRNKGKKFTWTDEAQVSFENIKRELCEVRSSACQQRRGCSCWIRMHQWLRSRAYFTRSRSGTGERFFVQ